MKRSGVPKQYDSISDWFDQHRSRNLIERPYLELMISMQKKPGTVLDLGCGMAEPMAQFFIEQGYHVTGIDGSHAMIKLCQQRYPEQHWLVADMRDIQLNEQFDVVLAWHSLFHLTHDEQRQLFHQFKRYLKPQGLLAFTTGIEHGEHWSKNGGEELYHASLSLEEYRELLEHHGLTVVKQVTQDPNCGGATVWITINNNI